MNALRLPHPADMGALSYADPQDEDERGEWIEERTNELVRERMADPVKFAAALDELSGTSAMNSDGNSHFSADLAQLLMSTTDMRMHADRMMDKVSYYLRRDAETQAEADYKSLVADGEEARSFRMEEAA